MNCNIYIFGNLSYGYTQYPDDNSKAIFKAFYKNSKAPTQICVHRDGNLMYYSYIRKLAQDQYIGICILLNNLIYTNIDKLFDLFENVTNQMILDGIIIQFNDKGEIVSKTAQLHKNLYEIGHIETLLRGGLNNMAKSNFQDLPPVDFSQSHNSIRNFYLYDDNNKIIESTHVSGYTFIYKTANYDTGIQSFKMKLEKMNKNIEELEQKNNELITRIDKLNKEKRNTTWVSILSAIVLVLGTILWTQVLFPKEVTKKNMGEYVYYGPMRKNKPNGTGVAIYQENDKDERLYYYGNFRDGKRIDENAIMFYKDGSYYKGSMHDDEWEKGIFFDVVGKEHFIGDFKNNQPYNGTWYKHTKVQNLQNGK